MVVGEDKDGLGEGDVAEGFPDGSEVVSASVSGVVRFGCCDEIVGNEVADDGYFDGEMVSSFSTSIDILFTGPRYPSKSIACTYKVCLPGESLLVDNDTSTISSLLSNSPSRGLISNARSPSCTSLGCTSKYNTTLTISWPPV